MRINHQIGGPHKEILTEDIVRKVKEGMLLVILIRWSLSITLLDRLIYRQSSKPRYEASKTPQNPYSEEQESNQINSRHDKGKLRLPEILQLQRDKLPSNHKVWPHWISLKHRSSWEIVWRFQNFGKERKWYFSAISKPIL